MEVTERDIARFRREYIMRHCMLTTDQDSALGAFQLDTSRNVEMPRGDKGQTIHLRPQRFKQLRIQGPHAGDDGRTRLVIQPRKVGKARRRWVGDGEDMSCQGAARIDDRHEVARRLDLSVMPPHISNNSDVKCFQ